jgi:5-methylcytosine-specific restriction endonuclease McrA
MSQRRWPACWSPTKARRERALRSRGRLLRLLGNVCYFCGTRRELTFDDIVPVSVTGRCHHGTGRVVETSHYWGELQRGNLQILCRSCNSSKNDGPQRATPYAPRYMRELMRLGRD